MPLPMLLVCGSRGTAYQPPSGNHLGAGLDDRAAFDELLDELVLLEPHEGILRVEVVVLPVEADDHADGEVVLLAGVDDAAAEHAGTDGPASRSGSPSRGRPGRA